MGQDRAAFAGSIADLPVTELLRTIAQGKHTGVARFETETGKGCVWFTDGELVDAEVGNNTTEAAIYQLLSIDAGSFEVEFKPISRKQVIHRSIDAFLREPTPPPAQPADNPSPQSPSKARRQRRRVTGWQPTGGGTGTHRAEAQDDEAARGVDGSGSRPDPSAPGPSAPEPSSAPGPSDALEASGDGLADSSQTSGGPASPRRSGPAKQPANPDLFFPPPSANPANVTPAAPVSTPPAKTHRPPGSVRPPPKRATPPTPPRPAPIASSATSPQLTIQLTDADIVEEFEPQDRTELTPSPLAKSEGEGRPSPQPPATNPTDPNPRPTVELPEKTQLLGQWPGPRPNPAKSVSAPGPASRTRTQPGPAPQHPRPDHVPSAAKTQPSMPISALHEPSAGGIAVPAHTQQHAERITTDVPRARVRQASGPQPVPVASSGHDGQVAPRNEDELSGPISVGATWSAPTHAPLTPRSQAITSGQLHSAGGTISSGAKRTVLGVEGGVLPPTADRIRSSDPSPSETAAYPKLRMQEMLEAARADPSRPGRARTSQVRRVEGIAQRIGLSNTPPSLPPSPETEKLPDPPHSPPRNAPASGPIPAAGTGSAPAVVGRYEVLLRIARGGMGTVYLCRVTGEGGFRRLFALKVIRDHLSRNDEYVKMLLQEARIASRLHHPNVVSIVDIGTLANQHYLVMDYVEGCTFSELLKVHRKSRPPHLIIPVVLDALTGLHAAHSLIDDDGTPLTLVHCDFSPQNMLVGINGICRITDFGISKATNTLPDRASVTRGKPAYLSPEQVTGQKIDHRSDIFSAGVVLWNALTGEQLFSGERPDEILRNVLERPIPPPSSVGLRPPSCLDRICLKALQRDPAQRYQTAEEMLMDLRRVAITEDFLAPSSEVASWVNTTFGHQLELRRQAAGISTGKALAQRPESQPVPVAVPELGLGQVDSDPNGVVHSPSDTAPDEETASRTTILRPDFKIPPQRTAQEIQKRIVLGLAAVMAIAVVVVGAWKPDLIQGGFLDEHGEYYPIDPPVVSAETDGIKPTEATDGGAAAANTDSRPTADTDAAVADTDGQPAADTDAPLDGKPDVPADDSKAASAKQPSIPPPPPLKPPGAKARAPALPADKTNSPAHPPSEPSSPAPQQPQPNRRIPQTPKSPPPPPEPSEDAGPPNLEELLEHPSH